MCVSHCDYIWLATARIVGFILETEKLCVCVSAFQRACLWQRVCVGAASALHPVGMKASGWAVT